MVKLSKEVRDYVLSEVNETLARLGVSESITTLEEKTARNGDTYYRGVSAPIRQMPKMFKKLVVVCEVNTIVHEYYETTELWASLKYAYEHYDGGSNGCDIGNMWFEVKNDMPNDVDAENVWIYVRRKLGLEI